MLNERWLLNNYTRKRIENLIQLLRLEAYLKLSIVGFFFVRAPPPLQRWASQLGCECGTTSKYRTAEPSQALACNPYILIGNE